ncbi:MAG: (2Fe-2S)-binding protein [Blastocatellia bacterium]|nr:(2Fe-2S)-binding protein [Blastocatellia bacterium]
MSEIHPEIFEPHERLIEIEIRGESCSVPENNSILRCFQFLNMEKISHADLCWNGDCVNCEVWIEIDGRQKMARACRKKAAPGMKIVRIVDEIDPMTPELA